jgi:hypothetical protein
MSDHKEELEHSKVEANVVLALLQELFDEVLEERRNLLFKVIRQTLVQMAAPKRAGEALRIAVSEYFTNQERFFLADINRLFPENVGRKAKP